MLIRKIMITLRPLGFTGLFFLLTVTAYAQAIKARKINTPITIDGEMNEPEWQLADVATRFRQYFPFDTAYAQAQTEVRILYDDQNIYLFAKMYNNGPRSYVTPSLRRDFRGEANDGISFVFDTFRDRTNAFIFGINPFGVQREGLIVNGGSRSEDFSLTWDNKWYAAARQHQDYWTAEAAIPFKSIRFKDGETLWYVNFYRIDSHMAERSTWAPIPRNFDIVNLAFGRDLHWEYPLKKPGANVSLIPYVADLRSKNFLDQSPTKHNAAFGGDAKVAVSPALNLDLTINPDFSQVEVDQQVTNLDRFEIFFPERRQFFLENADLFAGFGVDGTRPFFSRRIGIAVDTATGQNLQNPLYFGARLSGKLNNNLRLGLLSVQAAREKAIGLPSTNYSVATLQQKIWSRSNIGFILINKQAFRDSLNGDFTLRPDQYNRLAGVDFNLATADNTWNGKLFYHQCFRPHQPDSAFAMGGFINYNTYAWQVDFFARSVGKNYYPEVGFVRRRDIQQTAGTVFYNFYPAGKIQSHGPGFDFDVLGNETYGLLDWDVNLLYRIRWKNTARLNLRLRREYTYLFASYDPTETNGPKLPADTEYYNYLGQIEFLSDSRKKFFYQIRSRSGGYFNGTRLNLSGQLSYRMQPYGLFSVDFSLNRIRLPQPYRSADLILISPRMDITLTRALFWTTFVQYNSQINNVNINSRLQWRFAPVSDLFLVYTDNYATETYLQDSQLIMRGQPKLRAFVFKLTYWLNI
jgi:hypothetical protein